MSDGGKRREREGRVGRKVGRKNCLKELGDRMRKGRDGGKEEWGMGEEKRRQIRKKEEEREEQEDFGQENLMWYREPETPGILRLSAKDTDASALTQTMLLISTLVKL